MMVKFATTCDFCPKRSVEYTSFPSCIICNKDFCPDHGKITIEADVDQSEQGYCFDCEKV